MEKNKLVELKNIVKAFNGEPVLRSINLDVHDNEFMTLLGPSGCGKTTTLRIIGGFATPDSGDVFFDGVRINDVPPHKRQVNTVFQKYALFPHLNVYENVAFALRLKKTPEREVSMRVAEMLELVNGQVPLLIEIKRDRGQELGRLEPILMKKLEQYQGNFIIEAFDPEVLIWLRRNAPQYLRGQLGYYSKNDTKMTNYYKYLLFNPLMSNVVVTIFVFDVSTSSLMSNVLNNV